MQFREQVEMEGRSVRKTSNKLVQYRKALLESMQRRFEEAEEVDEGKQRMSA